MTMPIAITLAPTIANHTTLTEKKNMADQHDNTILNPQSTVTTQSGGALHVMPSAIASRAGSPIPRISVKAYELKDGQLWAFDLQLVDQKKGAANPATVNEVLGDAIAKFVARHCNIDGLTDEVFQTYFRALYRPAAGKVFTINIREVFKPLIPKALPDYIFVQDPSDAESKFKPHLQRRDHHRQVHPRGLRLLLDAHLHPRDALGL